MKIKVFRLDHSSPLNINAELEKYFKHTLLVSPNRWNKETMAILKTIACQNNKKDLISFLNYFDGGAPVEIRIWLLDINMLYA